MADPVEDLLARIRKQVERFWDQFPSVHCTEIVTQSRIGENGKPTVERRATFDYLVLMQLNSGELTMDESRVQQGAPAKRSPQPLLTTGGFSTLILVFHPHFQDSFTFALAPQQEPGQARVHFTHVRGRRSPAVLQLRNREYPIRWEGDAWIHSASGMITRINAGLAEPLEDVGLRGLLTEVVYAPVRFDGMETPALLPQVARIEARTVHQRWKNEHLFSAYRRFGVSVDSVPQLPPDIGKVKD